RLDHKVAQLDTATPLDMRGPGAASGLWALESAMDELSYKLKIDPLELRLKNYAERDQNENKDFSSKELRECYRQGAREFGWEKRNPEPCSMEEGDDLIGWGMATGVWEAFYGPSGAKAVLTGDGKLEVSSATADIGTGTLTIMTQIAAETLGLPIDNVTFKLGDSSLPTSYSEGGSATAASVGSAVKEVCDAVREKLFKLANNADDSPLADTSLENLIVTGRQIVSPDNPSQIISITDAISDDGLPVIEEETTSMVGFMERYVRQMEYTRNTHSAVFAEVKVDKDLGTIHVTRIVTAVAAGRILNPTTARSQILGGVVWGIGMALHEESLFDQNFGRFVNHNLGEYHVPVNADIPDIEVIFVEEHDEIVNPLGVKGVGEIGIIGVAAAIANAVFHATGKRIRELPITLDKLV
ncbi:MAG TPA: xanthine dehydrogenase family protein molybdopterin-binding subunit, partial [Blastocatellia bacterium]|nr:xanthine dehydrogenase family protein molybdopterin-binding subunit [Blastocatellia bacterium]